MQCPQGCKASQTCVDGSCVDRACAAGQTRACDNCGAATCQPNGLWGPCEGGGPCFAGEQGECGNDGSMSCEKSCAWDACSDVAPCTPDDMADCGHCGTMVCNADKTWGACVNDGPCTPGETSSCGDCSLRTCTESCQWEPCARCGESGDSSVCQAGVCVSCGGPGEPCCGQTGGADACASGALCSNGVCTPVPPSDGGGPSDAGPAKRDGGPLGCSPLKTTAPLMFYYGLLQKKVNGKTVYEDALNFDLVVPGLDVVFGIHGGGLLTSGAGNHTTGKPESGEFKQLHDHCARIAYVISASEIIACLFRTTWKSADGKKSQQDLCPQLGKDGVEDLALFLAGKLQDGYDYVAVDEIKPVRLSTPAIDFTDSSPNGAGAKLMSAILRLETMGYAKRAVLWFSPGTTSIISPLPASTPSDKLYPYKGLLKFCQDHCRKMIFETYAIKTSTVVDKDYHKYHEVLARRLHNILPGTNEVSMAGVGVGSGEQDRAVCDLAPFRGSCYGTGKGGLESQFDIMQVKGSYASFWRGVGFYALGAVEGAAGVWDKKDFAAFLRSRTSRWVGK
jgi:hypothetical protein